jgi:hypothetical protein
MWVLSNAVHRAFDYHGESSALTPLEKIALPENIFYMFFLKPVTMWAF